MNILIQAHILLTVALTLLGMANTANVSPEFRLQAETASHQAIDFATKVISEQTSVPIETPPITGSVTSPVVQLPHMNEQKSCDDILSINDFTPEIYLSNVYSPTNNGPVRISASLNLNLKNICNDRKWFVDITSSDPEQTYINVPLKFNGINDAGLATYIDTSSNHRIHTWSAINATQHDEEITLFFHSPDSPVTLTKKYNLHFDVCAFDDSRISDSFKERFYPTCLVK